MVGDGVVDLIKSGVINNSKKITLKNSVRIIEGDNERLVIKRRDKDLSELYKYLKSRSFDCFPDILYKTDNYDVYRYIDEIEISNEEKPEEKEAWIFFYLPKRPPGCSFCRPAGSASR